MKTLFFLLAIGMMGSASAQIRSVSLQASGLTCSMCSRAIYKSLKKLPEVASIKEDIEHSTYQIQFSDPEKMSLENLKKAVKDAGFSVAWMEVNVSFQHTEVASDSSLKLNDFIFNFVDINRQTLNGETRLLIVDKEFLQEKDRKKYAGSFEAIPTGNGTATFHVTLPQS